MKSYLVGMLSGGDGWLAVPRHPIRCDCIHHLPQNCKKDKSFLLVNLFTRGRQWHKGCRSTSCPLTTFMIMSKCHHSWLSLLLTTPSSQSFSYFRNFGCLYRIPPNKVPSLMPWWLQFPLVSRSGRIRKLLLDAKDSKVSRISIPHVPGGAQAFEIAAKFCYGINTEITLSNVAMLHCASHFLEMSEEYADKNLETRTGAYIKDIVLPSISKSIQVLHQCENLLPIAEEISLVNKIITAIANNACKEQLSSGLSQLEHNLPVKKMDLETPADWWGRSLNVLNLDFFQRVMSALKLKGLKQDLISKILVNYTHTSLQGIVIRDPQMIKGNCMDMELQKKQRVIIEAMVSLLPTPSRKSCVPPGFLSSLLKGAIASSASLSCKADLERRIGLQLDQAVLEDILIPANSHGNSHTPMYDTDTIMKIFSIFLNLDEEDDVDEDEDNHGDMLYDFGSTCSPKPTSVLKVSRLLDNYLAEIALDSLLSPSKFIALAELLPDHARIVTDGLYRAVDIFLKVHQNIKDPERYRLCKTLGCEKLSQEACGHAAQNERLPVQIAVQVLYLEQMRLKKAIIGGVPNQVSFGSLNGHQFAQRSSSGAGSGAISPGDNYASVRRENRELKLEVARMRMRVTDLEKEHASMKQEMVKSKPGKKLLRSFSKRLSSLNSFFRVRRNKELGSNPEMESRFIFGRQRNCSVS